MSGAQGWKGAIAQRAIRPTKRSPVPTAKRKGRATDGSESSARSKRPVARKSSAMPWAKTRLAKAWAKKT
jgi:hypothetical protein